MKQTIGKYVIERHLGSGAMGTVYLGYYAVLDRRAAIKVMKTGLEDKVLRNRFFREGRAAAKLDHPNIIKVWDLETDAHNRPYIAMEYVEGEDLSTYIKNQTDFFLSFEQKLRVVIEVCRGLHHAHEKGIIHRDIKPGNIRISRNGEAKILDFGLAKFASADGSLTGSVLGTPYYMSPEQWRGVADLDRRSDLFSLAAVLYELITYTKAFEADSVTEVMNRILSEPHVPLTRALPACASELSNILDRALAKDRRDRFESCEEFALALEEFLSTLTARQQEILEEVQRLGSELERYRRKSQESEVQEFLDNADSGEDSPDGDYTGSEDYGLLLRRHAHLQEQLGLLTQKLRAALPLMRLLQEGNRQLQEGQLEACQKTVQQLLAASPQSRSALRLRESCRNALIERRRQTERRAQQKAAIAQAHEALDKDNPESATQILKAVLSEDPSNPDAGALLERIREQEKRASEEKNRRISELLETCLDRFTAGEYAAACAASEELVRLSSPAKPNTGRLK